MRKALVLLLSLLLAASLLACGKTRESKEGGHRGKVLATVNGVPITERDIGPGFRNPEMRRNVLQNLVRQELVYQKAVKLKLDEDPEYRRRIEAAEAQLENLKKQEMSKAYRRYIQNKTVLTEADVRGFFEKNADFIKTKYHVQQIFYRGEEAKIVQDHKDIRGGMPFEEVASRRFSNMPKGMKPWDTGVLSWQQIPIPWRGVVDRLEPGQVSEVIRGPGEHFWVIRLVGKTVDPGISYDTEKGKIAAMLRNQRYEEMNGRMLREMEEESKIVYVK